MPQGPGTYGSKVGRPAKKDKMGGGMVMKNKKGMSKGGATVKKPSVSAARKK